MSHKALLAFAVFIVFLGLILSVTAFSFVTQEGDKTYIVDRTGERWDVTQAKSIGFDPARFQYGIGRNAFTPLDDSNLSDYTSSVSRSLRVISVSDGSKAQAYSVPKLWRHEIANSSIGSEPIAVGY